MESWGRCRSGGNWQQTVVATEGVVKLSLAHRGRRQPSPVVLNPSRLHIFINEKYGWAAGARKIRVRLRRMATRQEHSVIALISEASPYSNRKARIGSRREARRAGM